MTDTFIADYARQAQRRRTQQAQASTAAVGAISPDRMATAQRNAALLGLSPDAVYADPSYDREAQQVRNA